MIPITISGGYQHCSNQKCSTLLLNDDAALTDNHGNYWHPACAPTLKVTKSNRKALRVLAYLRTHQSDNPEYWQKAIADLPDPEMPIREAQFEYGVDESGDIDTEPVVPTGQRWNGSVYQDCREFLTGMAARCDIPKIARLMEEIAERQAMWECRKNLYVIWSPAQIAVDKAEVHHCFVSVSDMRNSVGLDTFYDPATGTHRVVDTISDAI